MKALQLSKTKKRVLFEYWYMNVPVGQFKTIHAMLLSKIPSYTLYNWRRGRAEIPNNHIPLIESIAGQPIFNA